MTLKWILERIRELACGMGASGSGQSPVGVLVKMVMYLWVKKLWET